MASTKHLLVLGGPTASGKTSWAIRLARHFGTEVLSADSRQFFREMRIGTASPSLADLRQIPHHFIGHLSIRESYSVGDYERDALARLEILFQRHDVVVLTGGSGLYLKALCEGLDEFPHVPPEIRQAVQDFFEQNGLAALQAEVARVDPAYFDRVDTGNPARLLRALAVCRASGRPYSSFRRRQPAPRPFTSVHLQLHWNRPTLFRRIEQRVDDMMAEGLTEEARQLYPFRENTALQTVGYQELFDHFDGKCTLEEAVSLIKRNSRRYAKRQITWMRRDGCWKHIGPDDWALALDYIELVRKQGWRVARLPASDLVSAPLPLHAALLFAVALIAGKATVGTLPVFKLERFRVLHGLDLAAGFRRPLSEKLLVHEAVCLCEEAGESGIFAVVPEHLGPFLQQMGFVRAGENAPKIQGRFPVLPGEVLFFR